MAVDPSALTANMNLRHVVVPAGEDLAIKVRADEAILEKVYDPKTGAYHLLVFVARLDLESQAKVDGARAQAEGEAAENISKLNDFRP